MIQARSGKTHQGHCRVGIEAIEHEISIGYVQLFAGCVEYGLECPFPLTDPYESRSPRSKSTNFGAVLGKD